MKTPEQASNFIIDGLTISGGKVSETEWKLFIDRVRQIQLDAFDAGHAQGREYGMKQAAEIVYNRAKNEADYWRGQGDMSTGYSLLKAGSNTKQAILSAIEGNCERQAIDTTIQARDAKQSV